MNRNTTAHQFSYFTYLHKGVLSFLAGLTLICASCGNESNNDATDKSIVSEQQESRAKSADYRMPTNMDSLRSMLMQRLPQVFNDSNYLQLAHAEYMGIIPIERVEDVFRSSRPVVKISDTDSYKLDSLTHSVPFLVPEASQLLTDIGTAFRDSIKRRHLPLARLKVTSLLRTKASVKSLRRVNKNATEKSTHQYATTFDIGYSGYYLDSNGAQVNDPRYKTALAEVLYDLRSANRCMVKYEKKSPCFHITVIQ